MMESLVIILTILLLGGIAIFLSSQKKKGSSLEKRVDTSIPEYVRTKQELLPYEKNMPKPYSLGEKVKLVAHNIGNLAKNAVDTFVIGPPIAWYQNYKTKDFLTGHQDTKQKIVYLKSGLGQTKGSQWRLAGEVRKQGMVPYHVTPYHDLTREKNIDKTFGEIKKLHKETGLKEVQNRKDIYSGHSSGADVGIAMAADERTLKHGIKYYQARAPVPSGLELKTAGHYLIAPVMPNMTHDIVEKSKVARETAIAMNKYRPQPGVKVHVVAGREDDLATPDITVYKNASGHHLYKPHHKGGSTHFGTSGVNEKTNRDLVDMLLDTSRKKHKWEFKRLKPQPVKPGEYRPLYEAASKYKAAPGEYNPLNKREMVEATDLAQKRKEAEKKKHAVQQQYEKAA